MLTSEQLLAYLEQRIAQERASRNGAGLKELQTAAGVLMAAANYAGDQETAYKFRVQAAHAANKYEELTGEEG